MVSIWREHSAPIPRDARNEEMFQSLREYQQSRRAAQSDSNGSGITIVNSGEAIPLKGAPAAVQSLSEALLSEGFTVRVYKSTTFKAGAVHGPKAAKAGQKAPDRKLDHYDLHAWIHGKIGIWAVWENTSFSWAQAETQTEHVFISAWREFQEWLNQQL